MSSFALNIQFTSVDAQRVNDANQRVTIVKEVEGTNGSQTAWLTFSPFENNDVQWENSYGVYASTTQVQAGATIIKSSDVNPAQSAIRYPFASGTFGSPTGSLPANTYGISNNTSQQLTFGLVQAVRANSEMFAGNPLNAVPVLNFQEAEFRAVEIVQVYLSAFFDNGVVIASVSGTALRIDLTSDPTQTIHYDGANGRFVTGQLP